MLRPTTIEGMTYGKNGQYDQAISDYTKALKINPKFAEAYYYRGRTYGEKGQYGRAISDYTKAIEINPGFAEAYYNRGVAYYYKKRIQQIVRGCGEGTKFRLSNLS